MKHLLIHPSLLAHWKASGGLERKLKPLTLSLPDPFTTIHAGYKHYKLKRASQNTLSRVLSQNHIYEWTQCSVAPEPGAVSKQPWTPLIRSSRDRNNCTNELENANARRPKAFPTPEHLFFPIKVLWTDQRFHTLCNLSTYSYGLIAAALWGSRDNKHISSVFLKSMTKHDQCLEAKHHCD